MQNLSLLKDLWLLEAIKQIFEKNKKCLKFWNLVFLKNSLEIFEEFVDKINMSFKVDQVESYPLRNVSDQTMFQAIDSFCLKNNQSFQNSILKANHKALSR